MIGAIIGDIVGSRFEFVEDDNRQKDFTFWGKGCCPTDDSFMTLAVAQALVANRSDYRQLRRDTVYCMKSVARAHPRTGWGERFYRWLFEDESALAYNSYGNGAGMRISPVGWVAESEQEVRELSDVITGVTHNHPEGMKGAQAVAMAVYLAREGADKAEIRARMQTYYPQLRDESFCIKNLYGHYGYDEAGMWVTCQGSVPHAIVAFLDSNDFADAVRNAVYIGGDSDTIGAMAGSIAEAYYGVDAETEEKALSYLSDDLQAIYHAFRTVRKPRKPRANREDAR